jgi:DNA-binding NarL/FixJ family response regulator
MATHRSARPVRLAVQSNRRLVGDALVAYFASLPDFVVVGQIAGPAAVIPLCELRRPDVLLLDVAGGATDAFRTLVLLRQRFVRVRPVLAYERLTPEQIREARRCGAAVLVPSAHGLAALVGQLRRQSAVATVLPAQVRGGLTDREIEIIMLLGCGHSVPEIADLLGIAAETVENHKRRIYAKLHARSAVDAVARAASLGLVPNPCPAGRPVAAAPPPSPGDVTARECDILRSIALGHTVRQTAQSLGIAPKTVENIQARLFGKLGVRNRAGALAAAYELGLLSPAAAAEEA